MTALAALAAWPFVSCLAFRRLPGTRAAFVVIFGGWAVLPVVAALPPGRSSMPGIALPASTFVTKATVIGISALFGAAVFRREAFRGLRFRPLDAVAALFCLLPPLSALANGRPVADALLLLAYPLAAWGALWLVGRAFLRTPEDFREWAAGFGWLGLAYLPIVVAEFLAGPFLYEAVYGAHSYAGVGEGRYFGHRGMGFLEDGNQFGMWLAASAVAAAWLWRRDAHAGERAGRRGLAALALVAATVLAQSVGSILFMLAGLALLPLLRLRLARAAVLGVVILVVAWLGLRVTGVLDAREAIREVPVARELRDWLKSVGRGSLGFRLKQNEVHLEHALEKPWLGRGRVEWWSGEPGARPWGLWAIVLGAFGLTGLGAMVALLLGPVVRIGLRRGGALLRGPPTLPRTGLAVVVLLCFADSVLNSTFLLPVVAIAGGLAATEE